MSKTAPHDVARTAEEIGRELLDRALTSEAIVTLDEAVRLHRAIGWPPPQVEDGVIRPPTPDELARWNSTDAALVGAMTWHEIGVEIEYRSPSIFATLLASARQAIGALRAIASGAYPAAPEPGRLEVERILATGDASAGELSRAHAFLGWDPPRFSRGYLQPPTAGGAAVADVEHALPAEVPAWRGKVAPFDGDV